MRIKLTLALFISIFSMAAAAEEMIYSGFMSDYTQLEKVTDGTVDYRYLAPNAFDRLAKYNAIMIDQPEIFIAVDSPYRGAKPKHLNALAESLRSGLSESLGDDIYVVDQPGENVLYLTSAITNLKLTKRKKKALSYLPVAFVVGSIAGATSSEIAKKAEFAAMVVELEAFDSVSGERLVAVVDSLEADPDAEEPKTWEDVDALMLRYGGIISCRFENAHLPESERADCFADD